MTTRTVIIPSISCPHCIATIERTLRGITGVESVEGNVNSKSVTVSWREPADWESIRGSLVAIDYPPEGS